MSWGLGTLAAAQGQIKAGRLRPIAVFGPTRLADLLRSAELRGVDCLIMDTAAGLNAMTESVVKACDYVVLPQQAEPLAVRSVPHMLDTLSRFRSEGAPPRS